MPYEQDSLRFEHGVQGCSLDLIEWFDGHGKGECSASACQTEGRASPGSMPDLGASHQASYQGRLIGQDPQI